MKISTFLNRYILAPILFLLIFNPSYAQLRTYATSQSSGTIGACIGCSVTNNAQSMPQNAADGNLQTYSTLNVAVGLLGGQIYQDLKFAASGGVQANTPVTVKLGTGDNLLDATLLGGIKLQAFNGSATAGPVVLASTLVSALSSNDQRELTITPTQKYDRIRVTLDGGLLGLASSIYLYDAFYTTSGPAPCNTAIDELHGISSALLGLGLNLGGVQNPGNAIDGNINTYSTLNAGVGLAGAYAEQTIIFQNQSVQGDSVRVTLSLPPSLLTATVLANISISSFNGNTSNNDTQTFNSSLIHLQLLGLDGTNQKVTITYAPPSVFDRVQIRLGGGVANVLSTMNLYEAQRLIPRPVVKYNNVVTNNVQLCSGSAATLTVNSVPNTTFNWYNQPTGGTTVAPAGTSFTTPALTSTTTYYVEATRTGCTDASERTPVTITVTPVPAAPVIANNNINACEGQTATFVAQSVPNVTVNWYNQPTGGTLVGTGTTFTSGPLSATTSYYAEAVSTGGACTSPARTQVTATISPLPAAAGLTAPTVTICDGDVAVLSVASPVTGTTYNWYNNATGGAILFTGANFTTPALHSNTSYYVEAVNTNGCSSSARIQGNVIVQPKPADPILTAGATTISGGQTATITVSNAQTGVTYNWYTSPTAATPVATGTTFTTPQLAANTTYYVSATNSSGCTSTNRTAITINVNINNNAPCSFANAQTSSTSGVCIGCSVANDVLAADGDTTTAATYHIIAGVGAYAQQELRFQQQGFAGDGIKIGLQSPVGLTDVNALSSIQVIVSNGATQVASYTLDNSLVKVRLLNSGNRYIVTVPATGDYDRVTVRLNAGVLSALTSLQVFYAQQLFAPPVFNPVAPEVCKGSPATINITSPANGTFTWYDAPVNGNVLPSAGNSYTTGPLNANTTVYVQYTRNGCTDGIRYPVTITVDDTPVKPVAAFDNVTIYSGQTATLTATAANGATVKWYDQPTGGNLVATGNTFTTVPLTTTTPFYAEASSGSCVSAGRTLVTVNVLPVVIPDVAVNPPVQNINAGETTSFTASSTTPGAVFNWYDAPANGTLLYTGPTYTTTPQFTDKVFYAEAVIPASGAKSAARATATVNVNTGGTSTTPCDAAIDQTTDINGLCLLCSINNPGGSVDNDRNTFSQLSVPVGLLGAYAQQTLRFAGTGRAGDSVVVELGTPGSLADVTLLSGISLATYNGTTFNNDRTTVNGSLLNISLLNGTSRFRIAFKATADFDRVEIRLNSVASVLSALNIYDASQEVAAPVIAAPGVTTCAGSQTTLTAAVPGYVTVRWYNTPAGGTPLFTGNVFTTPVLNATTTYYAEASRTGDGCAQSVRTPATVTVNPLPDAPVVAVPNVTVCAGQPVVFAATPVAGVTHNWYTAATGGTPVFTGDTFTTDPLTANATYYVDASNGACANSTRTRVTATVSNVVNDPAVAQTSVQTCSGSPAVLTASSTQPGVTFSWYSTANGTAPVFTGAQFTTPALTANASYFVEASAGTCVSAHRIEVDVVVNPTPDAPTVTVTPTGGQITSGQTAVLKATSTTAGATFNWYTAPSGGTPIFTGDTYTTPVLTSNTTYYVESALPTGCVSPTRTAVTVIVNPIFSTNCDFASSQTNGAVGVCVLCTITGENNPVDGADTTNFSRIGIPVSLLGGSYQQTLDFSDKGNLGDTVVVKLRSPDALITANLLGGIQIQSLNGGVANSDMLSLNNPLIKVQLLTGGQTVLVKFAPNNTFDAVQITLNGGLLGLLNTLDIYYASKQVEAPQLATNTVNICSGTTAQFTVSNARAGVTYTWYDAPVNGHVVGSGSTFTSQQLSATTTFYVESSRGGACPNPNRVAATANVTPSPVTPTLVNDNFQVCSGDNVTLTVNNAGGATVNWYDAPTGGNLVFTGATFQVTPVVSINYYAELTNGTCTSPSRKQATIVVNPRPAKPGVVSSNVTVCAGSPATLAVLNPELNVTYDWYADATTTTSLHTGTTYTTDPITQNTVFYVQATGNTGGCTNNGGRTPVNVNTDGTIGAPVLSAASTQVCYGGGTSISVVNPVNGLQYKWYDAAIGGNLVFTGTTLILNNLTADASYFVEADNAIGCVSNGRTQTAITVLPIPTAPTVQASANGLNVCIGSSTSLSIDNPQVDQVYRWYTDATAGTLLFTGTQFNTPVLTATTTYYVEASTAGNCNPSARTSVTVNVIALPTDPALVSSDVQVCAGSPATFTISSPQANVKYDWYDSPAQTTRLFEGNIFVTGPINTNTTFYVSAVNMSGCTSTNLISVRAIVLPPPPVPIVANGSVIQSCAGSQVSLGVANPQPDFTYRWYDAATNGNLITSGASISTGALSANAIYYVEAVNSIGCTSLSRAQVSINVNPLPAAPVVTAQGGSTTPTICAGNSVTLTATSTTPGVVFNWYDSAAATASLFTGAIYTAGPLTANATYYVEAVNPTTGCTSSVRTAISVAVVTPPSTPVPADAAVTVCSGSPANLAVASPLQNVTYNWYGDPSRTTILHTGATYVTDPVSANTTYYVEASNGSCTSPALATVQVNINPIPSAPLVVNNNVTGCANSQVILSIVNPQTGFTYNWYSGAMGGTAIASGTDFTTPQITASTVYYAEAINTTGCPSATRTAVNVTLAPSPTPPQAGTQGTDICAGNSTVISASSTDPDVTISWYADATGGTALATGNTFTTPVLNTNATYYAEAVSVSGGCVSLTRTPIAITVRQPLDKPVVSVASTTTSSVTFQWNPVTGATGYQVSTDNGLAFNTPSSGANGLTHTISGLNVNQSVTIIVKALGGSACQLGTNSDAVTGISSNPMGDDIFVPNAFTPNGDGNNDILYVYGTNIQSLTFTVYDQYGEMIFRSLSQSSGWDGTYKGMKEPVGVYVYIVEAKMNDGNTVKKKGSITLLR